MRVSEETIDRAAMHIWAGIAAQPYNGMRSIRERWDSIKDDAVCERYYTIARIIFEKQGDPEWENCSIISGST